MLTDRGLAVLRSALLDSGRMRPGGSLRPLGGGVSGLVAVVDEDGAVPWVAKMPRARLAVVEEWFADRARGGREADALIALDGSIGPLRVPRLRFVERGEMLMGMEFIAAPARPWKADLLSGRVDEAVVEAVGAGMAALHRRPVPESHAGSSGRDLFHALRTGPYYRTTAGRVPRLAPALQRLIDDTSTPSGASLIHGDLNPKNVLVTPGAPVLLDWEIAHAGDPSFDLGMMTAHLLLKACLPAPAGDATRAGALVEAARALWRVYDGPADPELAVRHTGAIMAARLHGKSPVDYLPAPAPREAAMAVAEFALGETGLSIDDLLEVVSAGATLLPAPPERRAAATSVVTADVVTDKGIR